MSYSKKADPRVELHIAEAIEGIRAALAASPESSAIRAVALGGGYGRGEGGATPNGMPYRKLARTFLTHHISFQPGISCSSST